MPGSSAIDSMSLVLKQEVWAQHISISQNPFVSPKNFRKLLQEVGYVKIDIFFYLGTISQKQIP